MRVATTGGDGRVAGEQPLVNGGTRPSQVTWGGVRSSDTMTGIVGASAARYPVLPNEILRGKAWMTVTPTSCGRPPRATSRPGTHSLTATLAPSGQLSVVIGSRHRMQPMFTRQLGCAWWRTSTPSLSPSVSVAGWSLPRDVNRYGCFAYASAKSLTRPQTTTIDHMTDPAQKTRSCSTRNTPLSPARSTGYRSAAKLCCAFGWKIAREATPTSPPRSELPWAASVRRSPAAWTAYAVSSRSRTAPVHGEPRVVRQELRIR